MPFEVCDFPRSGVLFVIVWPTIVDGWGESAVPGPMTAHAFARRRLPYLPGARPPWHDETLDVPGRLP